MPYKSILERSLDPKDYIIDKLLEHRTPQLNDNYSTVVAGAEFVESLIALHENEELKLENAKLRKGLGEIVDAARDISTSLMSVRQTVAKVIVDLGIVKGNSDEEMKDYFINRRFKF